PYYRCNNKQRGLTKKNISREVLENFFRGSLKEITPTKQIVTLTKAITQEHFNKKMEQRNINLYTLQQELLKIEKQINASTSRFIETTSQVIQRALEKKIEELEEQKLQILQSIELHSNNKIDFETALMAVLSFMENPYKTWVNGDLKQKKLVQRLVFIKALPQQRGHFNQVSIN
ncbi:TPA: site specific recombinase, partial [Legionella pneumophila]